MIYEGEQLDKDIYEVGKKCNNTLTLQLEEGSSARAIKGWVKVMVERGYESKKYTDTKRKWIKMVGEREALRSLCVRTEGKVCGIHALGVWRDVC